VQAIFDAYLQPGSSLTSIAEQLNARGEKGPKGGIWRVQTIQSILRNPNYTGDFVWNRRHHGKYHGIIDGEIRSHGEVQAACRESDGKWQHLNRQSDRVVIADSHPAIVSRETFNKVQALLEDRRMRTTPHRGGGTFLFSDMLRCGHCGAKLYGADRKSVRKGKAYVYRRYVCASYVQSGKSVCRHHAVLEEPLRDLLTRTLQERVLAPENFERLRAEVRRQLKARKAAGVQQPADAIRKQAAKLDKQLEAAADRLMKVPDSLLATVVAKMEQLRTERDRLQAQLNAQSKQGREKAGRLEDDVDRAMKRAAGLSGVLAAGNPAAVREVFRQTVERIDCWFATEVRGKRTYYPLTRGLIRLRSAQAVTGLIQQTTAPRCATG
jgi:site-specific DNA recombinase